ncbi:MAG: hypothetical protein ACHRHE_03505 [Tepidisphaerales bacterium]
MIVAGNPSIHAAPVPALGGASPRRFSWLAAAALALLVSGIPAIWPGDGVWLWDEPMEFAVALKANQEHRLAHCGLSGSFPVPFGALGIHLYQLWLVFTHNPKTLVVLHALTCTVPTAIALLWMARTLRLNPWFAVAILIGPHIWFEARRLWQPTFCVPLGCMAIAAHASFVRGGSGRSLLLAIACAIAPLFIHLQAIPLSAAVLGHLVLRHRAALWRHHLGIAAIVVCFATLQGPYVVGACALILWQCVSFIRTGHNSNTPLAEAWRGPFLSGRIFSGWDGAGADGTRETILRVLASGAMALVWMGIALAVGTWIARWRRTADIETPADGQKMSLDGVRGTMLSVCAAGVGIHLAMCVTARLSTVHHYFFGTFGMYVLLAWFALDALPRWWLQAGIIAVQGLASAALTGGWMLRTHIDGWMPGFSPSIGEQVALVRQLDRYSDEAAYTEVASYMERPNRPNVLRCLRKLMGSASPPAGRVYSGRLFIRFRRNADGKPTNRIELVETETAPPGAERTSLVPEP